MLMAAISGKMRENWPRICRVIQKRYHRSCHKFSPYGSSDEKPCSEIRFARLRTGFSGQALRELFT